jgi:hypothetical protein
VREVAVIQVLVAVIQVLVAVIQVLVAVIRLPVGGVLGEIDVGRGTCVE